MPVFTSLIDGAFDTSKSGNVLYNGIRCTKTGYAKFINTSDPGLSNATFNRMSTTDGSSFYLLDKNGVKVFSESGSVTSTIDLPADANNFNNGTIVYYDGAIHLIGGNLEVSSEVASKHYRLDNGSWTELSNLPQMGYHTSATVWNGSLFYVGATVSSSGNYIGSTPTVYKYSKDSDSWSQFGSVISSIVQHTLMIPIIVTIGDSLRLFVKIALSSVEYSYQFVYENGDWRYINKCPSFTFDNTIASKFGNGYVICNGCDTYLSEDSVTWEESNILAKDYRALSIIPLGLKNNGLMYHVVQSEGVVETCLSYRMSLPKGTTIYSNDGEVATINGQRDLDNDTLIHVMNKPDNYLTVMVGDTLVLMEADTVNHRVYALKGMTINGQKIEQDGLITIDNLGSRLVVTY